jgi:hypothetical protein
LEVKGEEVARHEVVEVAKGLRKRGLRDEY